MKSQEQMQLPPLNPVVLNFFLSWSRDSNLFHNNKNATPPSIIPLSIKDLNCWFELCVRQNKCPTVPVCLGKQKLTSRETLIWGPTLIWAAGRLRTFAGRLIMVFIFPSAQKIFTVPSTGEQAKIPFARVNHAKYMVTDRVVYIGTLELCFILKMTFLIFYEYSSASVWHLRRKNSNELNGLWSPTRYIQLVRDLLHSDGRRGPGGQPDRLWGQERSAYAAEPGGGALPAGLDVTVRCGALAGQRGCLPSRVSLTQQLLELSAQLEPESACDSAFMNTLAIFFCCFLTRSHLLIWV